MSKHRIYEIAKEYNTTSKVIIDILDRNEITAKNHMSSVDETARKVIERTFARKTDSPVKTEKPAVREPQAKDTRPEQQFQKDYRENKEQRPSPKPPEKAPVPSQQPGQTQAALNRPKDYRQHQPQNQAQHQPQQPRQQPQNQSQHQSQNQPQQQPKQQPSQQPQQAATAPGQQYRPQRQDGQGQQHRPYRPANTAPGQQNNQPRPAGAGQGQQQQHRPPLRQDGQGNRPFNQNNPNRTGGTTQQASNQPARQQFSNQPGQQRSGSAPQAGWQPRPAAQQRPFGSNDRRSPQPGQPGQANTGQRPPGSENRSQYAGQGQGQGRPQPPRGAQPPDRRGPDGARLSQPSFDNRPFAAKKPDYAGASAAPKPPAPGSTSRPPQKNNRQTHPNQRGPSAKNANETDASRKGRTQFQSRSQRQAPQQPQAKPEMPKPKSVKLGEAITVKELSGKIAREVSEVIKKLMGLGIMATINQEIDFDTASLIAGEFGVTVEELPPEEDPTEIPEIEDEMTDLVQRPPVVTVMGHVDHGKTSLLDSIRQTNVIAQEAGGITQHIGAYQVMCQGKKIVFLDTPGHEAFTAMRARGAQITDIAILVVAADDGVMPQTLEAINHAKSAKVPIIVAINKIDRAGANLDRVKQQLSENGLIPEDWGGETVMVPVSAYQKTGINELLEMILLVTEMLELKANPNRKAYGTIIEAKLDKGRGPVSTILVQKGTLRVGDSIIAGAVFGKVRAMTNDRGEKVKKAEPSTPVEVLGLSDVPLAGDVMVAIDEKTARAVSEKRAVKKRSEELKQSHKVSLDDLFKQIQEGSLKDLNIVVKADVQGSIGALAQSIAGLKNKEVRVNIIHTGVGAINESDVMLASASNALIIGFNVRPDANARKLADSEKIDIRTYRVIYEAINDVEAAITGMLAPEYKEVIYGRLEIRQLISVPKAVVAGSYVLEGKVTSSSQIRLIRDGIVIYEGRIESLRRFKDDVKEVSQGYECGLTIEKYRDIKEGDILESFGMEQVVQKTG